MRFTGITIIVFCIAFTATMLYESRIFSRGMFDLFRDNRYSLSGIRRVENFNPDTDILYLPRLGSKGLFASIDDLSICRRKDVRSFIYLYLTVDREYLIRAITRSGIYLDVIEGIFRENPDMPADLALLPLLESGFDPTAVSRSSAVGLWQFMRNTSSMLGLRSDGWIDERRHIEKSTRAAIRHLRNLHSQFGSWPLALAAYNGGSGQISRAMRRTGAKTYWDLVNTGSLSDETSQYVARFAALAIIYHNQDLLGLEVQKPRPLFAETETVRFAQPVDIADIAEICGTAAGTLKALNPELSVDRTPPAPRGYALRLPKGAGRLLLANGRMVSAMAVKNPSRLSL